MQDLARRLKAAVRASGLKQEFLAEEAGITASTLSRILNGKKQRLDLETIATIAHRVGTTVGYLLGETEYSQLEIKQLRRILGEAVTLLGTDLNEGARSDWRERPALPEGKRVVKRTPAAASPDRELYADARDLPDFEIPNEYYARGARKVVKVIGDSMVDAGILDGDVLFVRPERDVRAANGRTVVCRIDDIQCVKVLEISGRKIRLVSANPQYKTRVVNEDAENFRLIGIVIGQTREL